MTTGDEEADNLVDNLFREVDDQFKDLEREYSQAREDIVTASSEHHDTPSDALEASNERFELQSQVATLRAELSRQSDELDERDRMLSELGDKVAGFQADIAERDETLKDLRAAKQEALDERREQARLSALLDARAAERHELAEVAQRLQNERDHVQELLTTALARFDEADTVRVQMDDKLRHLEAARDTAAHEHDVRAHELIESRAEMSKVADQLDELSRDAAAADQRAEKAEALAERRSNEAGYLNRRIDAMNDKLTAAADLEQQVPNLQRELSMSERRISELERNLATQQSEASAAQAAVEAIAERTVDYDELVVRIGQLEEERDAAWEAASGYPAVSPAAAPEPAPSADEVTALADRARELSTRRANEAELAAQAAETTATEAAEAAEAAALRAAAAAAVTASQAGPLSDDTEGELEDLDDDDVAAIESDLAALSDSAIEGAVPGEPAEAEMTDGDAAAEEVFDAAMDMAEAHVPSAEPDDATPLADVSVPRVQFDEPSAEAPHIDAPQIDAPQIEAPFAEDAAEPAPEVAVESGESTLAEPVSVEAAPAVGLNDTAEIPVVQAPSIAGGGSRRRAILPADLVPNTPEAVAFLLKQPGVIAIVDARSTCGRTGIRPSELFERIARLRDDFDLPVEVVVTPVSTPVGGAPDLPAIGVHYVTGADTVADRIRALCMGFPPDQPLVVIAGDDHVRRAAIGEEANVVEPSAVLNVVAD